MHRMLHSIEVQTIVAPWFVAWVLKMLEIIFYMESKKRGKYGHLSRTKMGYSFGLCVIEYPGDIWWKPETDIEEC